MFRFFGLCLFVYTMYRVFTSDLFHSIMHYGPWILGGFVVLAISGLFTSSGSSSSGSTPRGGYRSGGSRSSFNAATSRSHGSRGSVYDDAYARELKIQTRRANREFAFAQMEAENHARHARWRAEDAAEQARHDEAIGRNRY